MARSIPPTRRRLLASGLLGVALVLAGGAVQAAGAAYLVVGSHSSTRSLAARDAIALFTGRTRTFPNGEPARALDQGRDSAAREQFYLALTGMDLARINSYWARLLFSGQVQPPPEVVGDAAVLAEVRRDPSAIGYVTSEPTDPSVRVVLVIKPKP